MFYEIALLKGKKIVYVLALFCDKSFSPFKVLKMIPIIGIEFSQQSLCLFCYVGHWQGQRDEFRPKTSHCVPPQNRFGILGC